MSVRDILIREAEELPAEKIKEVLDYVMFLKSRNEETFWSRISEQSLAEIWDSPEEDEAWKNL